MAATVNGDACIDTPIDENLFDGDDIDFVEDELDELELDDWRKCTLCCYHFSIIVTLRYVKFGCKILNWWEQAIDCDNMSHILYYFNIDIFHTSCINYELIIVLQVIFTPLFSEMLCNIISVHISKFLLYFIHLYKW